MKQQSALYEKVIESTTDGIMIIGFDGKIRMENEVTSEILNISESYLRGKTIASLMDASDENDEFFRAIIDAVYEKKKLSETVIYNRADGQRYLRLVTSFLNNKEEDIELIVVISDITELVVLGRKNQELNRRLIELLDNFVRMMIDAIDKRTPYNASHTRHMVQYAVRFLKWSEEQGNTLEDARKKAILASVWLHDIGKLVVPSHIMNKPSRLGSHEADVLHRIEVAILCEKLAAATGESNPKEAEQKVKELTGARDFVISVNNAGFVDEDMKQRVLALAKLPCRTSDGAMVPLLDDYETECLCIAKGTLTDSERRIMESHASHTYDMLEQMHLDGDYKEVPHWASRHHEYLNGTGYPEGLTAEELSWETRLLTVIDIYDALTAEDRPYKPPMPAEKAFRILQSMADEGKLDAQVLQDFHDSGAWKKDED